MKPTAYKVWKLLGRQRRDVFDNLQGIVWRCDLHREGAWLHARCVRSIFQF